MEEVFTPEQRQLLERATSELLAAQAATHQDQINTLRNEVQRLRTTGGAAHDGHGQPPPPPGLSGPRLVDTRLGRPATFRGEEAAWADWAFKFKAYVGACSAHTAQLLEEAELAAHAVEWTPLDPPTAQEDQLLRYLLVMLTESAALQLVRQHPGSGVEAFRALSRRYNPRSQARSLTMLTEILNFEFSLNGGLEEVQDRIVEWERRIAEYEGITEDRLSPAVRCAVLTARLPHEVKTHLLLTSGPRADYGRMKAAVESFVIAGRRWGSTAPSSSNPSAPMEVDAVFGKNGGGKGKGKNKGKDKNKGKGKHQEPRQSGGGNTPQRSNHSTHSSGKGSSSQGSSTQRFEGY